MKNLALLLAVLIGLSMFVSCTQGGSGDDFSDLSGNEMKVEKDYPVLKGTFMQHYLFLNYTDEQLEQHFDYLQEAGIEYIVLYVSAFQNLDGTYSQVYFPSEIAAANKGTNYSDSRKTFYTRLLDQCKSHGIKAFISSSYVEGGWENYAVKDKEWSENFATNTVKIAKEMYDLYKQEYGDIFYGWYFVSEFANGFHTYTDEHYETATGMLSIFLDGITEIDPTMPFLISPYFTDKNDYPDAAETAQGWDRIFSGLTFRKGDIFCPQDCVGSQLASIKTFVDYYTELKKVIDKYENLSLWGNPETFKQANWTTAPMTRYAKQLELAAPLVEGFISYSYCHYYAPDIKGTDDCHRAYLQYYNTGKVDYFSDNKNAILSETAYEPLPTGVEITADFVNSKYGISHMEVYRDDVPVGTVHTTEQDQAKQTISYSFKDISVPVSGSYVYTLKAIDFMEDVVGEISDTIDITLDEIEVGANISLGKSYTTDYNGIDTYPDRSNKMLTDGVFATTEEYSDANAAGFANVTTLEITIDLEDIHDIGLVTARALNSGSGGAVISERVEVEFSTDGRNFGNEISVLAKPYPTVDGYSVVKVPVEDVQARYVRVSYVSLQNWLFIDEIEVYAKK